MGHEALANWLNSEVRSNSQLISTALSALVRAPNNRISIKKSNLSAKNTAYLSMRTVMVSANNLQIDGSPPQRRNFHYYDEESIAFAG